MSEIKAKPGQYLTFVLGSELYGMPISDVREINQHGEVTPVPQLPEAVTGVMNLRGKIIPVINLRLKFGMPKVELTKESCIIVVESPYGNVGMIVDSVREVLDLTASQMEGAPQLGGGHQGSFISGIGKVNEEVVILVEIHQALDFSDGSLNLSEIAA